LKLQSFRELCNSRGLKIDKLQSNTPSLFTY
jgi:hypothetical protein